MFTHTNQEEFPAEPAIGSDLNEDLDAQEGLKQFSVGIEEALGFSWGDDYFPAPLSTSVGSTVNEGQGPKGPYYPMADKKTRVIPSESAHGHVKLERKEAG